MRMTRMWRMVAVTGIAVAAAGILAPEARAISSLQHPNICTLHDVGEENGQTFLVMEHLVGETLAERLKKGPLPLEQALEVAIQIADALAAAHKQDIVHRDLKPGNVMLTRSGAKLLSSVVAANSPLMVTSLDTEPRPAYQSSIASTATPVAPSAGAARRAWAGV